MEGKAVAIDSSIWIYQFQATMRNKDGQVLSNAHVLGFLRRICKLMFYGMKPVFVFDGGAPDLKKKTLVSETEHPGLRLTDLLSKTDATKGEEERCCREPCKVGAEVTCCSDETGSI